MARTVRETISDTTRDHLTNRNGLLFGECLTAVGWVGGTVPEMTEEEGIVEMSMADVSGAGIAVGAALSGRRPIYVIRYQGFMWYNGSPLVNYAAKSKEMWGIPCPILIRSIASEGAGPVAGASHHGLVMRMPGISVFAPMTPGEWLEGWQWFLAHDDPLYVSEHKRSYKIDYELRNTIHSSSKLTILAISSTRLNALEAIFNLKNQHAMTIDLIHITWLKPFVVTEGMYDSLVKTKLGLILDSDFEMVAKSIAYELMLATEVPIHVLGLKDRTAGFAPSLDNSGPTVQQIMDKVLSIKEANKKDCTAFSF